MPLADPDFQNNDLALWAHFKRGDEHSFQKIFEKYTDTLYNYGLNIVLERDLVKDAIQELFIELWMHRHNLAEVKSVKFYLLVSLRRLVIRKITTFRKITSFNRSIINSLWQNVEPSSDQALIDRETDGIYKKLLLKEINNLPPRQREAVFLRFYENMEYSDVERIMKLSNQVLRNTIFRAIKTLKLRLKTFQPALILLTCIFRADVL